MEKATLIRIYEDNAGIGYDGNLATEDTDVHTAMQVIAVLRLIEYRILKRLSEMEQ